jgi:hypothetical protein
VQYAISMGIYCIVRRSTGNCAWTTIVETHRLYWTIESPLINLIQHLYPTIAHNETPTHLPSLPNPLFTGQIEALPSHHSTQSGAGPGRHHLLSDARLPLPQVEQVSARGTAEGMRAVRPLVRYGVQNSRGAADTCQGAVQCCALCGVVQSMLTIDCECVR